MHQVAGTCRKRKGKFQGSGQTKKTRCNLPRDQGNATVTRRNKNQNGGSARKGSRKAPTRNARVSTPTGNAGRSVRERAPTGNASPNARETAPTSNARRNSCRSLCPFNKPNRRKVERLLVSMKKMENAVYPVAEGHPDPKGFYVLVNPWRPNESGANAKGESRIRNQPQVLVLGDTANDEELFHAVGSSSFNFVITPKEFTNQLMQDEDLGDVSSAKPSYESLVSKVAQLKQEKKMLKQRGREITATNAKLVDQLESFKKSGQKWFSHWKMQIEKNKEQKKRLEELEATIKEHCEEAAKKN